MLEQPDLRPDWTCPSDLKLLDYDGPGQHLYIDVTVRCPFYSTGFRHALRPKFQGAKGEKDKFAADAKSAAPVAAHCRMVPFALETGGKMGSHAAALLLEWSQRATRQQPHQTPYLRSHLAQRWSQQLS